MQVTGFMRIQRLTQRRQLGANDFCSQIETFNAWKRTKFRVTDRLSDRPKLCSQNALRQHTMGALGRIDGLRHVQVGGEAAKGVGVAWRQTT